jgi:hypothetical protein
VQGELVTLPVGHTRGILDEPDIYLEHALAFLAETSAAS